ncbi:ABC transporter [Desulfobacter hydrogenophilus]|uniref:ABC transporter n=1 Tax=Desulfobacter hydrogenophilus TaxID=2291 RepID=A0A328FB17_9BACT|nr:ABC transporter permease subunit [Desulfobacter hydrogenophilus]NDY73595.1 ABC transporter [Desulfobacter hydrogenophilus]QBH13688.1 ABC transporter [Desulfobacter hydrogenophilus]RAM01874.1 ABC transporter [Desulfobacter hydrogenophilus]
MTPIRTIALKEFKDYFISPIAYIVISLFLIVTGWFFFSTFFIYGRADLRDFFALLPITFSFFIPAVTMRMFAEEKNVGSYESLLTMPVSFTHIALGKFFAASAFAAAMLLPTLSYPLFISFIGNVDIGPVAGGYIGAVLLGGAYCSVGLFASALTRNQIIAFIIGCAICFTLTIIDRMLFFVPERLVPVVEYLGANAHFTNISKGIIDSRDLIYFASVIFIFIFSTEIAMKEKN